MAMCEFTVKAGTRLFFGAPAKPMPEIMADAISQVVAQVPGIVEAHWPQCFIEGDNEARQILVIGVQRRGHIPRITRELMSKLELVLAPEQFIDMLSFESREVPVEVRQAGCQFYAGEKRSWWKIW